MASSNIRVFRSIYGDVCVIEERADGTYECRIDYGRSGVDTCVLGSFEAARRWMRREIYDWAEV